MGGQVKGYASGGMPDLGPGFSFGNMKPYTGTQAEEIAASNANMAAGVKTIGSVAQRNQAPNQLNLDSTQTQPSFGGLGSGLLSSSSINTTTTADIVGGNRGFNPLSSLSEYNNANIQPTSFGQGAQGYPSFSGGFSGGGGGGGGGGPFPLQGQYGIVKMAAGGNVQGYNLGGYSDGGRLLRGPGDGVSDDIPAVIGDRQPARLADGEFVIPARIVSEIGNGSTDAGAKRLYAMMDKIQAGRKKTVGKGNVAKDTKAKKHLLA
jgi:hypothetical protein